MNSPRVLFLGGAGLAFGAAFANIGVVLLAGTSVSHLTGDLVRLSIDLFHAAPEVYTGLLRMALAMLAFLSGATVSGFIVHHPDLDFARPYTRTVFVIGLLFLAASWSITRHPVAGIALAAFACGLQNALASRYRGIILRTTHLTGLFTDLGISLGMRARGFDVPAWKLAIPVLLILSFFLGGLCGAAAFFAGHDPLRLAGIAYCGGATLWMARKYALALAATRKSP
jgi:uncharacterized membrane protein YoaK (UPF0700 family)